VPRARVLENNKDLLKILPKVKVQILKRPRQDS